MVDYDNVIYRFLRDPKAKETLDEAERALKSAQEAFNKTEAEVKAQYNKIPTPPPKPPFNQWALKNWPPYPTAIRALDGTKTQYNQAYTMYYCQIKILEGHQDDLTKVLDLKTLHQLYIGPFIPMCGNI